MIPKDFGPRLKLLRRSKHLNQSDISKILNITRQAYSNYETGKSSPPVDIVAELSIVLEYDFFSMFLEAAASKYSDLSLLSYQSNESEDFLCKKTHPSELRSFIPDSALDIRKKK